MKIRELLEWEPPLDPKPSRGRPIDPRGAGNSAHNAIVARAMGAGPMPRRRSTDRAVAPVEPNMVDPRYASEEELLNMYPGFTLEQIKQGLTVPAAEPTVLPK